MENKEQILKQAFIEGMKNKDFESFKRAYPTLLKCIYKAMDQQNIALNQELKDCKDSLRYSNKLLEEERADFPS